MAVRLSSEVEREIERVMHTEGFGSADEVVRSALSALQATGESFWERIERLDAGAEADVRTSRYRPVTDEFVDRLKAIVSRPSA